MRLTRDLGEIMVVQVDSYSERKRGRKMPRWQAAVLHQGTIAGLSYHPLIMNAERREDRL